MRIFNITDLDQLVERVEKLFRKPVGEKRDYTAPHYEEKVWSINGKGPVGYVLWLEAHMSGDCTWSRIAASEWVENQCRCREQYRGEQYREHEVINALYNRFLGLYDIGFKELSWRKMPYFRESEEDSVPDVRCRVICR